MGRDKRNERRGQHFARLLRVTMQEPAWGALSTAAQVLYPWLLLEWHGPDFNNNGKIRFSVRQASRGMGVGLNAAARAFHELQAKGFIVVVEGARLGLEGQARGPVYEITELGLPHAEGRGGRGLYRQWRPGADFPVHKGRANNPKGRNGKQEPCLQNEDRNVIKMKKNTGGASPK